MYLHTSAKKHQDPDSLIAGVIRVVEKVGRAGAGLGQAQSETEAASVRGRSGGHAGASGRQGVGPGGREGALEARGSGLGKKFGNTFWGGRRGAPLTPLSFPQDSDVLLQWVPVEEAGDSTQILFSKKVGFPLVPTCRVPASPQ